MYEKVDFAFHLFFFFLPQILLIAGMIFLPTFGLVGAARALWQHRWKPLLNSMKWGIPISFFCAIPVMWSILDAGMH